MPKSIRRLRKELTSGSSLPRKVAKKSHPIIKKETIKKPESKKSLKLSKGTSVSVISNAGKRTLAVRENERMKAIQSNEAFIKDPIGSVHAHIQSMLESRQQQQHQQQQLKPKMNKKKVKK